MNGVRSCGRVRRGWRGICFFFLMDWIRFMRIFFSRFSSSSVVFFFGSIFSFFGSSLLFFRVLGFLFCNREAVGLVGFFGRADR